MLLHQMKIVIRKMQKCVGRLIARFVKHQNTKKKLGGHPVQFYTIKIINPCHSL